MIKTKRILRAGMTNFWRNSAVAIASIFVLSTTLFVIGALYLGNAFLNSTLEDIKGRVDISVTFKPEVSEDVVLSFKDNLEALAEVESVTYSSKEEELASFRQRHAEDTLLIQSLDEVGNPFGDRLAILATDPDKYDAVTTFLERHNQEVGAGGAVGVIDQISYKKDIVSKLLAIINTSQTISLALSVILGLMSILVTFNTISLTIYTAREEISVMRLVGADNPYIRGPFVVEGVLAGVIAAFIAMILLYPTVLWVRSTTTGVYGGIDLVSYYLANFPIIFVLLILSGIILGTVSSVLAIGRYLKV